VTSGASPLASDKRRRLLALFAAHLYGPIPPPPNRLTPHRLAGPGYQRLEIALEADERRFAVDAALWLPAGHGPAPLIVGLDFLGPIGVLEDASFPLDLAARIDFRGSTVLDASLRGRGADRWPLDLIQTAGFGLLLSCYGSWVPDDPAAWRDHGLVPLLHPPPETGAIALWAWALSRLVDAALSLREVDAARVYFAGHSRLGKAALWAAASDERVAGVVANNSGCAGAALWHHQGGETLAQLTARYPHWLTPSLADDPDPATLPVDQHELLACIAPRRLYVASASEDHWADPEGEYLALAAAAPAWNLALPALEEVWQPGAELRAGALAWHLRDGVHDLTPWDWRRFLPHLASR
jgi:hypothetical protein